MVHTAKKYNLNKKLADKTLKNVLEACEYAPNSQSFDYILAKNIANTTLVKMGERIAVILLILVLLSPLVFTSVKKNSALQNEVTVVSHELDKSQGVFVMQLRGAGIEYSGIYAKNESGDIIIPDRVEEETGTVWIPFSGGLINIYVPSDDGTVMQAVLSK